MGALLQPGPSGRYANSGHPLEMLTENYPSYLLFVHILTGEIKHTWPKDSNIKSEITGYNMSHLTSHNFSFTISGKQ